MSCQIVKRGRYGCFQVEAAVQRRDDTPMASTNYGIVKHIGTLASSTYWERGERYVRGEAIDSVSFTA